MLIEKTPHIPSEKCKAYQTFHTYLKRHKIPPRRRYKLAASCRENAHELFQGSERLRVTVKIISDFRNTSEVRRKWSIVERIEPLP